MLTRFAPAPTGWLHLGHVANAEYVWGADDLLPPLSPPREVLIRIEDHDRERCRPEYEAGILEDLAWLGYRSERPIVRQSERDGIYRDAASALASRGLLYGCDCTRQMIQARDGHVRPAGEDGTPIATEDRWYSGHCRTRGLALTDAIGWRLRMDPGVESFVDARLGPQEQDPSRQCGDVLIRDRRGNWTYQFVVSVDDFRQRIDLVIRGEDLLASTGRQIRIARLLGRDRPATFFHHPLIMKSAHQKLSKSDGDTGIRDLRARGWTPADVKQAARTALSLSR